MLLRYLQRVMIEIVCFDSRVNLTHVYVANTQPQVLGKRATLVLLPSHSSPKKNT
jgi:hypothetical protein